MGCPCGKDEDLARCCGRYISGEADAPTAEALMRSRYSAFVSSAIDYLIETHAPSGRARLRREDLLQSAQQARWCGLEVVDTRGGAGVDTEGEVEFIARYSVGTDAHLLHERSRFVREGGRWFYVDGEMRASSPPVSFADMGRNSACPCGSGRKLKRCHG